MSFERKAALSRTSLFVEIAFHSRYNLHHMRKVALTGRVTWKTIVGNRKSGAYSRPDSLAQYVSGRESGYYESSSQQPYG